VIADRAHADSPSRAARVAIGLVAAIVALIVLAVLVLVGMAATSRPPAAAGVVVFTVEAPYDPGARQAAPVSVNGFVPPPQGGWTYARGVAIARRALAWVNWPYSFGAGDASGPTYGIAVDADSRNDAHIRGFDCSGLVINAMAPYRHLDHSASAQYSETGTFHPALSDLQPGDLVFWSGDGTIGGIGHVAIYVGNGNVVQAPHSGAYVDVVRLDQVEPGKIGVTRPLT
jgi:cell wall-associated NlpC family hydrolase